MDPLKFLARLVTPIPDPGPVMPRDDGGYASRTRGTRRRQAADATEAPVASVDPVDGTLRAARVRGAALLHRIVEVDPLAGPRCRGRMRIVAGITAPAGITRILTHRARAQAPAPRSRSRWHPRTPEWTPCELARMLGGRRKFLSIKSAIDDARLRLWGLLNTTSGEDGQVFEERYRIRPPKSSAAGFPTT